MKTEIILTILKGLIGACAALIPSLLVIRDKIDAIKKSKESEEKAHALIDLLAYANELIVNAEQTGTDGPMKKNLVMTRLEIASMRRGIEFDSNEWSEKIDELVANTKKVNYKEEPKEWK